MPEHLGLRSRWPSPKRGQFAVRIKNLAILRCSAQRSLEGRETA